MLSEIVSSAHTKKTKTVNNKFEDQLEINWKVTVIKLENLSWLEMINTYLLILLIRNIEFEYKFIKLFLNLAIFTLFYKIII